MYLTKHTLQASHYFFHTTYLIGQGPVLHLKYCYLLCFLSCTKINYFSINHPLSFSLFLFLKNVKRHIISSGIYKGVKRGVVTPGV